LKSEALQPCPNNVQQLEINLLDISELRLAALKQAADDTRTHMNGQIFHATPDVIRSRAEAYMSFLLDTPAKGSKPVAKKKR
jgi:hypothetical protein